MTSSLTSPAARNPHGRWQSALLLLIALLATIVPVAAPAAAQQRRSAARRATKRSAAAPTSSAAAAPLAPRERRALTRLSVATIRQVTVDLSAPEMEGRGTAQPGGKRAADYLAARLAKMNFKPLGDANTYLQAIKFKSTEVAPETAFTVGDATLKFRDDYVVAPPYSSPSVDVSGGAVFVGYGVVSPELKRDDLAGLDVKGKLVLVLAGQPQGVDAAAWRKAASQRAVFVNLFGRGAAGVALVNFGSKSQPYATVADYLSRRSASLGSEGNPPFKIPPILLLSDAGAEKIFAGSGATYSETMAKATSGAAVSRDLNKTATLALRVKMEEGTGHNVVGVLEGSDPQLKEEAIVYTAHYDAYGRAADGRIYPGAADNALGVAEIVAIAEAFSRARPRPRRSIVFLAVTGEEYGLLGSKYWVAHPTWPIEKVAADINLDGIGTEVYGPVKNVVGFGAEHSTLGKVFEAAAVAVGAQVVPDPLPEEKAFYRSDHYEFVKKGVPAIMPLGGPAGETKIWIDRAKKWMETDYHQPTDTVRPDWNWGGARTIAALGLVMGMRLDAAAQVPTWLPTSPFNQPRGTNAPPPAEK